MNCGYDAEFRGPVGGLYRSKTGQIDEMQGSIAYRWHPPSEERDKDKKIVVLNPDKRKKIFLVLAKHGGVSGPRVFHTKIHTTSKLTECDKGRGGREDVIAGKRPFSV